MARSDTAAIAPRLLAWHAVHGRHDLPWQRDRSAYRVWVSEIMLQQTQVSTVIPYFERFMERFRDLRSLAAAPLDEVLHLWTGLGYYARARNLHQAARLICEQHGGEFPRDHGSVVALPGIGRSTASAILAISRGERHAILDGNVKRVLARHAGIDAAPDERATLDELWRLAERHTPAADVDIYTQAIMDLGATLCTRVKPRCAECPLTADCSARQQGRQHELPARKRKPGTRRCRTAVMLVARRARQVLLVQRPPQGIWGGLWCLPEFTDMAAAEVFAKRRLPHAELACDALPRIEHSFTHFDLVITPLLASCAEGSELSGGVQDGGALWYNLERPATVGLPGPIKTLLGNLT